MPFCGKCGGQLAAENRFCGVCGAPVAAQPSNKVCPHCGKSAKPQMFFCDGCGHRLESCSAAPLQASGAAAPEAASAAAPIQSGVHETELIRISMGSYYKKLGQTNGTVIITSREIRFRPYGLIPGKDLVLPMAQIRLAERASVLKINTCMRVYMQDGSSHLFSMGLSGAKIQKAVDIVNTYKGK